MDIINLNKIVAKVGTPFYTLDVEQYKQNVALFKEAFLKRYSKLVIGYSFKTNYIPQLCHIAKELGAYAEVVSRFEYDLAIKMGFPGKRIIYNGPVKKTEDIFYALGNNSLVNLDSSQEVESVLKYRSENPKKKIEIGLRINIDLKDSSGESHVQCGLREGRFGFSSEVLPIIIDLLHKNNIDITSLHGHSSSSDRAVANYAIISNQMLSVCERNDLSKLKFFNIGGGFFGAAAKGIDISYKPTYEDYADAIVNILHNNKWFMRIQPSIVIEPGVSVVANTMSFYSKVYEVKKIKDKNFIVIDGSVYDVKPTLHQNNLPHQFIHSTNSAKNTYKADVVGSTCMEKDVILSSIETNCNVGDYIRFDGVGAYTIVMTPTFINLFSPILLLENGTVKVIRRRQTLDDFLRAYIQ